METAVGDLNRFYGRWHAQVGSEQVFLDFHPDGRFFYTGLFGDDTKEFSRDIQHPLEFARQANVPTWTIQEGHLIIVLKVGRKFLFDYSFSEDKHELSLTSLQTHETLTFSR
jgi:hypothetical protein